MVGIVAVGDVGDEEPDVRIANDVRLNEGDRRDPHPAGALVRIAPRVHSPSAPHDARLGAVSFLHRFGSSLNPHFHFHLVVLDGVFAPVPDGTVRFYEASLLDEHHWLGLQRVIQRRVLRHFRTRGLLDEADALSMLSWQGSGGFSIDAAVRIQGDDRAGVERLLRYCARPPFALERLHALGGTATLASPEARLLYRFPRPTPDGRTENPPLSAPTPRAHRQVRPPAPHAPPPLSRRARPQRTSPISRHRYRQASADAARTRRAPMRPARS